MKYAYYCNTCGDMFEDDTANDATVVCPRGQTHSVEYAGPIYFDLDDLDTGDPPPQIGAPPMLGSPGLVTTTRVAPPLPVSMGGVELGPPVIKKDEPKPELKKTLSFADLAKSASAKPPQPVVKTTTTSTKVLKEIPLASHAATTLGGKLLEDYEAIMKVVFAEPGAETKITWSSNTGAGPTVHVQTRLKKGDPDAELLYLRVRTALHGKRIPGGKGLTFYVGGLCPPLKAGFRISSHKGNNLKGLAILHVDN